MLNALAVEGYRSLRRVIVPLRRLNVVTGANGTGKSSLYRALRLLADASRNGAVAALAREGGLDSTLWAGPEFVRHDRPVQGTTRMGPVSLRMGFASDDYGYLMDLGLPMPSHSMFGRDPEIKREALWSGPFLRPASLLVERSNSQVRIRASSGQWEQAGQELQTFDSMLSQFADPQRAPELLLVRERMRAWRFYDHLRTDADAPARQAHLGTRTPILGPEGADLAAALQTINEIGPNGAVAEAIDQAFPGSQVAINDHAGRFEIAFHQHGLLRPLSGAELSDGTLRYLLWVAALLTPRPPELLVLNEPETSLHPDLLPALANLVVTAAKTTQVILVTHSRPFLAALDALDDLHTIELVKDRGATTIAGQGPLDEPPWKWPKR
ncbi:AAA family ATPase [Kribbella sandramycini]|uniref:AAA family ATPase n=1 Tax=Kribbella sandramycini TaxID=60450 RepID=A0A7Y4KVT9_9ACTN|nr:AAA family ATPase [Kribbella sandramycini]MBB6567901.1 putative ATPase [Kribbella sandramycini]NOL39504.1 AAA family ATPase [Kribbella sandramycini]